MVSTRSSSKTVEPVSVVMVYPEGEALRRFSMRLNALIKTHTQKQTQTHCYNLRPRPASASASASTGGRAVTSVRYNLRPRRQVCYAE